MKKTLLSILFMVAAIVVYAQKNEKKEDYVNFDEHGTLVSFQKTDLGGTIYEVGKIVNPRANNWYYSPLRIVATNGDIYDGEIGAFVNMEDIYRAISENRFDHWWDLEKTLKNAEGNIKIRNKRYNGEPPVTISTHDGKIFDLGTSFVEIPINENGDYKKFYFSFPETNDNYSNYDCEHYVKREFLYLQITLKDGLVKKSWSNIIIEYPDGSSYEGRVLDSDAPCNNSWWKNDYPQNEAFWDTITSVKQLKYTNGVFTDKNGKCTAYKNGKEDQFETARVQQTKDKQREKKAQEETTKRKLIATLEKQYGKKYTDAVLKGNLILGMPEDLFLLGVECNAFKRIYSIKLDYKSESFSSYKVYGWQIGGEYLITNRAFLGWANFKNGILKSMDFK